MQLFPWQMLFFMLAFLFFSIDWEPNTGEKNTSKAISAPYTNKAKS